MTMEWRSSKERLKDPVTYESLRKESDDVKHIFFYTAVFKGERADVCECGRRITKVPDVVTQTQVLMPNMTPLTIDTSEKGIFPGRISYCPCIGIFYVQLERNRELLLELAARLRAEYSYGIPPINQELYPGELVVARSRLDLFCYRASVIGKLATGKYTVFFVDFGNVEDVFIENIYPLVEDLRKYAPQAVRVAISEHITINRTLSRDTYEEELENANVFIEPISVSKYGEAFNVNITVEMNDGSLVGLDELVDRKPPWNVNKGFERLNRINGVKDSSENYPSTMSSNGTEMSKRVERIECSELCDEDLRKDLLACKSDGEGLSDPSSFYVQLNRDWTELALCVLELPKNISILNDVKPWDICLAPCYTYGGYYRAEVKEVSDKIARVLFVDYGNVEDVSVDQLFYIDETLPEIFRSAKRMAYHCRLYGILPPNNKREFDEDSRLLFSNLLKEEFKIRFKRISVSGIFEVTVKLSDGRSLIDVLLERGGAAELKWTNRFPLYETLDCVRSDETEEVEETFTLCLVSDLDTASEVSAAIKPCSKILANPRIGDLVIAPYNGDLYRGEIVSRTENNTIGSEISYGVRFVDYGNFEYIKGDGLYCVDLDEQPPEVIFTKRCGIRCHLDGVRPLSAAASESNSCWSGRAVEKLNSLLNTEITVKCIFGSPDADGVYPVKISIPESESVQTGDDLSKWLLDNNLAEQSEFTDCLPHPSLIPYYTSNDLELIVLSIVDQVIYARPLDYDKFYERIVEELKTISKCDTALKIQPNVACVNGNVRRVEVVGSVVENDDELVFTDEELSDDDGESAQQQKNVSSKSKLFLVDEGIIIENDSSVEAIGRLSFTGTYSNFIARTCHRLALGFHLKSVELLPEATGFIKSLGILKTRIWSKSEKNNVYEVNDMLLSDGRSLTQFISKSRMVEAGKASSCTVNVIEPEQVGKDLSEPGKNVVSGHFSDLKNEPLRSDESEKKVNDGNGDFAGNVVSEVKLVLQAPLQSEHLVCLEQKEENESVNDLKRKDEFSVEEIDENETTCGGASSMKDEPFSEDKSHEFVNSEEEPSLTESTDQFNSENQPQSVTPFSSQIENSSTSRTNEADSLISQQEIIVTDTMDAKDVRKECTQPEDTKNSLSVTIHLERNSQHEKAADEGSENDKNRCSQCVQYFTVCCKERYEVSVEEHSSDSIIGNRDVNFEANVEKVKGDRNFDGGEPDHRETVSGDTKVADNNRYLQIIEAQNETESFEEHETECCDVVKSVSQEEGMASSAAEASLDGSEHRDLLRNIYNDGDSECGEPPAFGCNM